jgi:hypothetical protein
MTETTTSHTRTGLIAVSALERTGWILATLAAWLVVHLYGGISHDAIQATMQALGQLQPDRWAQEISLRFASWSRYTLFTPLYALLISGVGTERAAQLLTIGAQIAFIAAAWRLARRLLSERQALAALLLLVALPGNYGAGDLYRILEDHVTPRLFAEGLVLAGIVCWLRQRLLGATLLSLLALVLDPLIGLSALIYLVWLEQVPRQPRLALMIALAALALLVLIGLLASGPPLRFDVTWYQSAVENMPQLQLRHWSAADWGVSIAPLSVLVAGIVLLEGPARALAQAALGIGLASIVLTAVGADRLHLVPITQGEPWRWLWLSTTIATLLVPAIAARLWRHSVLTRGAAVLLLGQYLLMSERYTLLLAALALGLLGLARTMAARIGPQYQRLAFLGALLIASLALLVALANYYVVAHYHYFPSQSFTGPTWLKSLREADHSGLAAVLLLALVYSFSVGRWQRATVPALIALGGLACCGLLPLSWHLWTQLEYSASDRAAFASWRALIPPGSEVLSADNPRFAWLALERPSYISRAQLISALYSRQAALVLTERTTALRPYLRTQGLNLWDPDPAATPGIPTLAMACAMPDLQFVVASVPLRALPIATAPAGASAGFRSLKLFRCPLSPDESQSRRTPAIAAAHLIAANRAAGHIQEMFP